MNTLHFKYAVEIEKTRSITQAAENLYMAQPNMSKAIKELENTLGITIFQRTSKGVIPTEQGMKFLEYAKQILIQIDNMEAIHSPDKQQKQKLRISVPRAGYIYSAFAEFTEDFDNSDDIETYLCETSSIASIADVREKNYNFGIIRFRADYEKYFMDYLKEKSLGFQLVWDYEMLAVMSSENPFAETENLQYTRLCESCTEIIQEDDGIPYIPGKSALWNPMGKRKICVFDRGSQTDSLTVIPSSFSLDSPSPEHFLSKKGLIQRKCSFPENSYRDVLIFPENHKFSESEMMFINKLYEVRNRLAFGKIY